MMRVVSGKRKSREIIVLCLCDQAFGVSVLGADVVGEVLPRSWKIEV